MGSASRPWVIVNGGLHRGGGMDRANAALVDYLLERGDAVHVVTHEADAEYAARPGLTLHLVRRPAGSILLGEVPLERRALVVHASLTEARLVANGGNCRSPDVNWVHSVHAAWPCVHAGAPAWFRAKNGLAKWFARARERRALAAARVIVANSMRTRDDVTRLLGVPSERIAVVPLGASEDAAPPTPTQRAAARAKLGIAEHVAIVAFVGALSLDDNKGFDVLLDALGLLAKPDLENLVVVAAGGGSGVARWRAEASRRGLSDHVRMLGYTRDVGALLAAADLLASPVRYEAFGLNVLEALTQDVPVLVSASAGIVERIPAEASRMVLERPTAERLAARMTEWLRERDVWRGLAREAGRHLRAWRWRDMAHAMVEVIESRDAGAGRLPQRRTQRGAA